MMEMCFKGAFSCHGKALKCQLWKNLILQPENAAQCRGTTCWLVIEVHFIFSMRQQQQINMQVSLCLPHVIQIMIL